MEFVQLHVRTGTFEKYFFQMRGNENSQRSAFYFVVCDSSISFEGEMTLFVCGLDYNLRDVTLSHDINLCQNKHMTKPLEKK